MGTKGKKRQPGCAASAEPSEKPNGDTSRTLIDIELALAEFFGWKRNIIAFNVQGLSGTLPIYHECDMLVVTSSGYLTEIEIKRSFADFCADFKKDHRHKSAVPMKDFCYAVPAGILGKVIEKLQEERFVPTRIITYDEDLRLHDFPVYQAEDNEESRERREWYWNDEGTILLLTKKSDQPVVRAVDPNHTRPLFLEQRLEIARLGAMRQIALRKKISELQKTEPSSPDSKLSAEIARMKILLQEYRKRFKEETGYQLDEKEALFG